MKRFLSTRGLWEVFAVDWDLGTNGISCYRGRHQDCFQSNPWWAPVKGRLRSLVREHIYTYKYVCKYTQIDICMYIWRCTLRGNAEVAAVGCFSQALHTAPCLPLVAMRELSLLNKHFHRKMSLFSWTSVPFLSGKRTNSLYCWNGPPSTFLAETVLLSMK